ncbi:sulfate permease [Histoplasma capsulatum G186AR]|uniref:Sulfate permease n=1 Tax=Ajellomyces capsulatus (strain G186AR / H82 / ATCC MYA-2454 / RMSCC 2432) TaxID=447093 RepID=C0NC95_AJECG|nr:sulfate permease [Histoplasma capsulatum G186AR]EEH11286.1 sulfate permease [Histoplasma capsulatum G186AR]
MTNSKGGTSTKVGNTLAKLAGIKKNYRDPIGADTVTRGESTFSVGTSDTYAYVEQEPSSADWLRELVPTGQKVVQYFANLFPFLRWITRYNLQWLIGITVGAVVVPQSMAYAKLAELEPQFGLYSSFMGVLIYWFFATSKDITIGPVAVMSTLVGQVVIKVQANNPEIPAHYVASALAIICGGIITFIGLIRCGWIVDFIPLTAITAFMTGSAISIAAGQVPSMMGIRGFDTRDATFRVIINTLKHLPDTKIDAAMGLTALFLLYLIRWACNFSARKNPNKQKLFFFLATLRTAFVILLYVMISWLVNKNHREKPIFRILGTVPRGFKNAAVPTVNTKIIKSFASDIPAAVIVLLIEHIAISKSFGRINNYTIDPSQELVAIGVTNLLGPFLGGYPATGSFSRTAIKSKAGVRTPFAGVITAVVVLLAIYALPAVFFYIPNSSLSAVIIHAVGDLITPPNTIYQFWRVSPLEVVIFFAGVFVTIFSSIENGIYCTVCVSVGILLFRVVKAQGQFLGRVKIHSVIGDHVQGNDGKHGGAFEANSFNPSRANNPSSARNIFLPLNHNDGSNPEIEVEQPAPGIFIYQFSEGFNYPNANHYLDYLVSTIYKQTRRTNLDSYPRLGDRPWCDPGPRKGQVEEDRSHLPTLKAIILDFSSVNNVDVTSIQNLIDVRNQLDRYAAPQPVHWHFAHINNRWTKRALVSAGFGYPTPSPGGNGRWKAIFSVAELGGSNSAAAHEALKRRRESDQSSDKFKQDVEAATQAIKRVSHKTGGEDGVEETSSTESGNELGKELDSSKVYSVASRRIVAVHGLNRPLFHMDLTSALQGALANSEATAAENNITRN